MEQAQNTQAEHQLPVHTEWDPSGMLHQQPAQEPMPNLMPAITTLIMQITSNLTHGNPQLALFFQPLVNMALNMQLQAWQQQATATAHQLPVGVMEQMHLAQQLPQQAAGAITIETNVAPVSGPPAQHTAEAVGLAAPATEAAPVEGMVAPAAPDVEQQPPQQQAEEQEQQPAEAQQAAADQQQQAAATAAAAVAAAQAQALIAAQAQAVQAAVAQRVLAAGADDAAQAAAGVFRESYESEASEGEAPEDDDDDYTAKGERAGGRRGRRGASAHRPQRTRKRNKMLEQYLTDEEGEDQPSKHRRAHFE